MLDAAIVEHFNALAGEQRAFDVCPEFVLNWLAHSESRLPQCWVVDLLTQGAGLQQFQILAADPETDALVLRQIVDCAAAAALQ